MQRAPSAVGVHNQQRRAVRIEAGIEVARQVDVQVDDRAGGEVPDEQPVPATTFVTDEQPLVTADVGEPDRTQTLARGVVEFAEHGAVGDGHGSQSRVSGVPVLGVRQHPDAVVERQCAHPGALRVPVDHRGLAGVVPGRRCTRVPSPSESPAITTVLPTASPAR